MSKKYDKYDIYRKKYHRLQDKYQILRQMMGIPTRLDRTSRIFIERIKNHRPIYKNTVTDARRIMEDMQTDELYKLNIDMSDVELATDNGETFSIKIIRPRGNRDVLPVVMYYCGGGWMLGSCDTHGRLMSEIAVGSQVAIIYVNYSLAPEKRYPTQIMQCDLALKYIAENGANHQLDYRRIILMGDDVGGNLAATVAILSIERQFPVLSGMILLYPWVDISDNALQDIKQIGSICYESSYWFDRTNMQWFLGAYEPDHNKRTSPLLSPINVSQKYLKDLPPTLIIFPDSDILNCQIRAYVNRLVQAGVDVTAVQYMNTIHDFLMLDALKNSSAARSALKLITLHIRDMFSQSFEIKLVSKNN